jgi:hypothetical protein
VIYGSIFAIVHCTERSYDKIPFVCIVILSPCPENQCKIQSYTNYNAFHFIFVIMEICRFVWAYPVLLISTYCNEDMTRMNTNIIRTYLGRDMDDEYVICLCTTIRAKDKMSLFLYYLFTYFENRLLPKNIIIIRNHGDDDGVLKGRHGGGEDQQGTSNPN